MDLVRAHAPRPLPFGRSRGSPARIPAFSLPADMLFVQGDLCDLDARGRWVRLAIL